MTAPVSLTFFDENKFLNIQAEVKKGETKRLESILKIFGDESISHSFMKESPEFCYKCIKLVPPVISKIPQDLIRSALIICAKWSF